MGRQKKALNATRAVVLALTGAVIILTVHSSLAHAGEGCLARAYGYLKGRTLPADAKPLPTSPSGRDLEQVFPMPTQVETRALNLRRPEKPVLQAMYKAAKERRLLASGKPTRGLARVSKEMLEAAGGPKTFSYLVSATGELFIVEGDFHLPPDRMLFVGGRQLIVGAGDIRFDLAKNKLVLSGREGFRPTPEEIAAIKARIEDEHPELQVAENAAEADKTEKVIQCSEILAKGLAGKGSIRARLLTNWILNTGAFSVKSAFTHFTLRNPGDRGFAEANLSAATVGSLFVGYTEVAMNASGLTESQKAAIRMTTRLAYASFGNRVFYKALVPGSTEETSKKVSEADAFAIWNTGYFLGNVALSNLTERMLFQHVPYMAYEGCRNGSIKQILLSPGVARFMTSVGTTTIYFVGSWLVTGH